MPPENTFDLKPEKELWENKTMKNKGDVHVVLVSLLANHFFGRPKRIDCLRDRIFFCPLSWFFLSSLDIREWPIFKKKNEQKIQDSEQKNCPVCDTGQFSFGQPKIEKLTRQLQLIDWPKRMSRWTPYSILV